MGHAAEQIIAGVVLSERLAVTMYGAIHRAQFSGQRNLRGLVVDAKLLAESSFRLTLTDHSAITTAISLDHRNIVPTFAVESGGPEVVVVTRGVGRYVTVQDLISAARANRSQGGKLPTEIAAAIGRSVIEALAASHKAGVVHGAVHPRSVLIDEDGGVRLGDFVVGRALTTAVAQGADSALWRGLAGYLAPELVVGEDPSPGGDVFAVGALLFTMLSGEVPPGSLHVTPAVERLVQRALDTDISRRYRSASDLLENLLEAFEDDRWEIADRGEVIKAAGLSRSDSNVDEATEDLLASLGSSPSAVQVTPIRPSADMRAVASVAYHTQGQGNRLDALLADLDDGHTAVDDRPFSRDPISEVIARDPRRGEAIVQLKARVPSLDDPDDETPLPPPTRDSDQEMLRHRPRSGDERAAMNALAELDEPAPRRPAAVEPAPAAPVANRTARPPARAALIDIPQIDDLPPVRLKSRALGIIALVVVVAGAVAIYVKYQQQEKEIEDRRQHEIDVRKKNADDTKAAYEALADLGTINVTVTPSDASVWLKLGRSNLETIPLSSNQMHQLRIERDDYQPVDTEVIASNWDGTGEARHGKLTVVLKPADKKARKPVKLPAIPAKVAEQTGFTKGEGKVLIETSPTGAEVWLLIGYANSGVHFPTVAGRAYELRALADGYKPGYTSISPDDWREPGGDSKIPIDMAKKRPAIDKHLDLEADPEAPKPKQGK